jgi:DUF438 domain-containing protein
MESEKAEVFRELLRKLQKGEDQEEVKKEFADKLGDLSEEELAEAEKELIASGVSPAEVQNMCDIHAQVYLSEHGSCSEDCSSCSREEAVTALDIMRGENQGILSGVTWLLSLSKTEIGKDEEKKIRQLLLFLSPLKIHYAKKEDLFFPHLYRHGVSSVPQVMWGVDSDILKNLKELSSLDEKEPMEKSREKIAKLAESIKGMVDKENGILFPLIEKTLLPEEEEAILKEMPSLGFPFLEQTPQLQALAAESAAEDSRIPDGFVSLSTGRMSFKELQAILNALPFELTFIDKDGFFRYFNKPKDPAFIRTKAQLDENVEFCHPVKALPAVRKILTSLSSGEKDSVVFSIKKDGRAIKNTYIALKSADGKYLGCLEVSEG